MASVDSNTDAECTENNLDKTEDIPVDLDDEVKMAIKPKGGMLSWCLTRPLSTKRGKRQLQITMFILFFFPFATILSLSLYMNTDSIFDMIEAEQTKKTIEFSVIVGKLIMVLQKEQDQSALYLSSIGPQTRFFLTQTYRETDHYLVELPHWPVDLDRSDRQFFASKKAFKNYLDDHRKNLGANNVTIYDEIIFYKKSIDVFLIWLYDALKESRYSNLWKTLVAYQKIIYCLNYAGIERALGTMYLVEGKFSDPHLRLKYSEVIHVFKNTFEAAMKYSDLVKPIIEYNALVNGENLTDIISRFRYKIQLQTLTSPQLDDAAAWYIFMSSYIKILFNFQTELAEDILQILSKRSKRVLNDGASSSLVIGLVLLMLPLTFRAIYNLTNLIQLNVLLLLKKTSAMNKEKRTRGSLMRWMLPKLVVGHLTRNKAPLTDKVSVVTVLKADIPVLVKLAFKLAPVELISMVNCLFEAFDDRIKKFDVHKVESNESNYVVVAGLHSQDNSQNALKMVELAFDFVEITHNMDFKGRMEQQTIDLRVGIHTGPVVAGVVGSVKPQYQIFGKTLKTTTNIMTHGEAGWIHVSSATKEHLCKHKTDFILEKRTTNVSMGMDEDTGLWVVFKKHAQSYPHPDEVYSLSSIAMDAGDKPTPSGTTRRRKMKKSDVLSAIPDVSSSDPQCSDNKGAQKTATDDCDENDDDDDDDVDECAVDDNGKEKDSSNATPDSDLQTGESKASMPKGIMEAWV